MIDVTTPILRPGETKEEYLQSAGAVRESLQDGGIPENLAEGLVRYLLDGIRPGHFLQALLKNDLKDAVLRYTGDMNDLPRILHWLLNCVPSPAWGSPQEVERWITKKSLERWGKTLTPEDIE